MKYLGGRVIAHHTYLALIYSQVFCFIITNSSEENSKSGVPKDLKMARRLLVTYETLSYI